MTETTSAVQTGSSRDLAVLIARTAHDMKCQDVVVLELGERSAVANYFVLATGTGTRQIRSTADEIQKAVAAAQQSRPWGKEGIESANWVLLDYVDVVVHLFDGAARAYYDLEMLWGDSPRVEWQRPNSNEQ